MSPKARKYVKAPVVAKRRIGVPHDGSELPGLTEWLSVQEGSTTHAQRMAAGEGRAQLEAILATAPELATQYRGALKVLRWYDLEKALKKLPAKYTNDYKDHESGVRRLETFCAGVVGAVNLGINEPWAVKTYVRERVKEFDGRRRRKRAPSDPVGQTRKILQLAHTIIANRLADDYESLRRELGQRLKGDVSDSNITKVLAHHSGELAKNYGKRFAPKSRRG